MKLARITSRFDDLPDLYTFECSACGVSHIEASLGIGMVSPVPTADVFEPLWRKLNV
jgi:hypothetical protein